MNARDAVAAVTGSEKKSDPNPKSIVFFWFFFSFDYYICKIYDVSSVFYVTPLLRWHVKDTAATIEKNGSRVRVQLTEWKTAGRQFPRVQYYLSLSGSSRATRYGNEYTLAHRSGCWPDPSLA
jgi:hypothetical protein